ncbi:MAG: hypothetical protein ONB05_06745, partial [candidate division KSB1 bacterium]|nr:hypothetical protein [candidate division KSB1 bacterium]
MTGLAYVVAPVSLYFFVRYLTQRDFPAVVAGLAYSLLPSMAYLIPAEYHVAARMYLAPKALISLLLYGEGAHIFARVLLPVVAIAFLELFRKKTRCAFIFSILGLTAIALTSMTALQGFFLILFIILVSELLQGDIRRKLVLLFLSLFIAGGLTAFWFTIPFLRASLSFAGGAGFIGNLYWLIPPGLPLGLVVVLCFKDKPKLQPLFIAAGMALLFATVIFSWFLLEVKFLPFANRYLPELDMAISMLIGMGVGFIRQKLAKAICLGIIILIGCPFLSHAWLITAGREDLSSTTEFQVSKWLADRVEGERVFCTGTHAFWLNFFTDVPQIRGGTDFAAVNPWWHHVSYQIVRGADPMPSILWAKAFNVKYIVVNYPESEVWYKDYLYPEKFENTLPVRYSKNGDKIFEVPLLRPELVQAVDLKEFHNLPLISHVVNDTDKVRK